MKSKKQIVEHRNNLLDQARKLKAKEETPSNVRGYWNIVFRLSGLNWILGYKWNNNRRYK